MQGTKVMNVMVHLITLCIVYKYKVLYNFFVGGEEGKMAEP